MDATETKEMMEELKQLIMVEESTVTCRWLSINLKIHPHLAQKMINEFTRLHSNNLQVMYCIVGTKQRGDCDLETVALVPKSRRDSFKKCLKNVKHETIYAISLVENIFESDKSANLALDEVNIEINRSEITSEMAQFSPIKCKSIRVNDQAESMANKQKPKNQHFRSKNENLKTKNENLQTKNNSAEAKNELRESQEDISQPKIPEKSESLGVKQRKPNSFLTNTRNKEKIVKNECVTRKNVLLSDSCPEENGSSNDSEAEWSDGLSKSKKYKKESKSENLSCHKEMPNLPQKCQNKKNKKQKKKTENRYGDVESEEENATIEPGNRKRKAKMIENKSDSKDIEIFAKKEPAPKISSKKTVFDEYVDEKGCKVSVAREVNVEEPASEHISSGELKSEKSESKTKDERSKIKPTTSKNSKQTNISNFFKRA